LLNVPASPLRKFILYQILSLLVRVEVVEESLEDLSTSTLKHPAEIAGELLKQIHDDLANCTNNFFVLFNSRLDYGTRHSQLFSHTYLKSKLYLKIREYVMLTLLAQKRDGENNALIFDFPKHCDALEKWTENRVKIAKTQNIFWCSEMILSFARISFFFYAVFSIYYKI